MEDKSTSPHPKRRHHKRWKKLLPLFFLSAATAFAAGMLLVNIIERKEEAKQPFYRVVELNDTIEDPAIWGKNFPLQYDGYLKTVDQERTRFGGSEAVQRTPTKADPRSVVARSRLEMDPRLKIIWEGYAFSKDFRERRGHAHMLTDQSYTERQVVVKQPGTCLHCHASIYVPYKRLGGGDLMKGFERMNAMPYAEARMHVNHPIACIDCHDPVNMQLRVSRPAFMEGIAALKATQGVRNYKVNEMATRAEMRSFVCAQCHDEYYFKGPEKRLTYPWAKGNQVEQILNYYDEIKFKDWVHPSAGSPMLKAQHPEFELWSQGIHARSGVSCADCHMPYYREGAMKISDHHVRSPVLNLNRACQTCHHWPEAELKSRVEEIQDKTFQLRNKAMDAVVDLITDLKTVRAKGIKDEKLQEAQHHHRRAQFMIDFIESENSVGFHAPQEAVRVLGEAINEARLGQVSLRELKVK